MTEQGASRRTASWIGTRFHTFVFGAYPVLVVAGVNAGILPTDGGVVARCLLVSAVLTAALLAFLKPVIPDPAARAGFLSFVFISFTLYAIAAGNSTHAGLAVLYTAMSGAAAALIVRPWRSRPRRSTALNLAACAVLGINVYSWAPAVAGGEPWRPMAGALIDDVVASAGTVPRGPKPDIYYVVLDGFGRPDILAELYDLDLGPVVSALESRGFTVPQAGRSNYAQTFLSLGSSLNLSYLDPIAKVMQGSADRRALHYLIQNNALMKLARRAGYRVVAIGSDSTVTERIEGADECRCESYGLNEIEATAISLTPLRALPLDRWTYDAHRRKVSAAFDHLRNAGSSGKPTLVFAHLLSPHPPFVFRSDGRPRTDGPRVFTLWDGASSGSSPEEYKEGYREQALFLAERILSLVDDLLSRPGPSPVIVLHGDHGPALTWNWDVLDQESTRERMGILSAYRLPGDDPPDLPAHITPVNALRLVANRHLGTALPPLPDRSFASIWRHPYRLALVPPDEGAEPGVDALPPPVAAATLRSR